jgi:orotidine-5'-phosphate decarboxylase
MTLSAVERGLVVACDVTSEPDLERVVAATGGLDFVRGFKVGVLLALSVGLRRACTIIRRHSTQDIIYDHQKFGTDIPDLCGGAVLGLLKDIGVTQVIAFPFAGIETLKAFAGGCQKLGLEPIVGGEMTHAGFLVREGGYIANTGPTRIYQDAAGLGIRRFVVPATKPKNMARHRRAIEKLCAEPAFLFPGVGKGQGGDIVEAFRRVDPHAALAIVGRGIYAQPDPAAGAASLWNAVRAGQMIAQAL